jgi:hypothetical protein
MLQYRDGREVHVGDRVRHFQETAIVTTLIEGEDVVRWGSDQPGFMISCERCGDVLIEPDYWECELEFLCRGE